MTGTEQKVSGASRRWVMLLVAGLVIVLVALGGCAGKGQDKKTLKVGVLPVEDNFPFFVADQEKMFSERGLSVELVPFNSARERDMAMQAGQIDGETADPVAVALLRKAGTSVKIVSLTLGAVPEEGRFALLASPQSEINQPEDLAGATLAISENTIIEYVADRLLFAGGIDAGKVEKTPVPDMPQRMQLLVNNRVDSAVLPDPLASEAEKQGAKVILDDTKQKENLSQVVLVFREEVIAERQADLTKVLEIYSEAADMINSNPAAYQDLFVQRARVPENLKDSYRPPHYSSPVLPPAADLARVMDWMVAKGLLTAGYSYQELVEEQVLKDLKQ